VKRDHALAAVLASSFLFCLAGPARADLAIIGLTGGVPEANDVDAEVGLADYIRRWRSPGIQL
jgi:hypothetical protein